MHDVSPVFHAMEFCNLMTSSYVIRLHFCDGHALLDNTDLFT
jgi:hypothetical protein